MIGIERTGILRERTDHPVGPRRRAGRVVLAARLGHARVICIPPRTCTRFRQRRVGGVEVDVNTILKPRYGQW